uniref:Uncharacterized protein n=1 Tax=Labrus bergylta TaxID=56723 RepID=A0A3Q3FDZ4_9LABR
YGFIIFLYIILSTLYKPSIQLFFMIAFMTVTLFPIRLLIAAFMMLLAWPFAFLASVGRSETTIEPQCLWRRWVLFFFFSRVIFLDIFYSRKNCNSHSSYIKYREAVFRSNPIQFI